MALKLAGFLEKDNVEDEENVKLKINKKFATYYDKSRRSEELMKLKARYGDVKLNEEIESDSESEDEDAEELTPAIEQKWLKTLAALKSNDPKIYDEKTKFFDDSADEAEDAKVQRKKVKKKKEKKITLKDMDRKVITEREGKYSDNSSDSELDVASKPVGKGYYEEQEEIRKSILEAQDGLSSDGEDDSGLLTVKVKTAAEKEIDEEEYRKFIKGQKANVDDTAVKDLSGLRDYWNREDMTEGDKFLKDYILEKKYLPDEPEHGDSSSEDSDGSAGHRFQLLSEDEDEVKRSDQFELKYNFRFEEPDAEFIKNYPRTVNASMRIEKNQRKEKRAKLQERKDKEKQKKQEELNRLKNLKKQEIEEKLNSIMKKSGAENMPFTGELLEGDFDPDEHDQKMKEMFPEDDVEDEILSKPTFEFDPEIDDNEDWDNYAIASASVGPSHRQMQTEEYLDLEDPNFVMDADYDPNAATLEDRNFGLDGRSKRNKRKKNSLRKALDKKKPLFNPDDKSFEQYLDEYYGLEFEDTVGDLKCRFPYREVPANDFGLSVGEILSARDKELNSWSSLKKTVQYRTNEEEFRDITKFRRKSHDINKKKRLLPSLFHVSEDIAEEEEEEEEEEEDKGQEEGPSTSHTAEHTETAEMVSNTKLKDEAKAATKESNYTLGDSQSPVKPVKSAAKASSDISKKQRSRKKRKFNSQEKQDFQPSTEQSSRGMSFKRMEAYGMHGEVKRVKKLRSRDKRRN